MRRRMRITPYSRTGCCTCKRRHKKCDGHKPICKTCDRLNLECHQPDGFRNNGFPSPQRTTNTWGSSEIFSRLPSESSSTVSNTGLATTPSFISEAWENWDLTGLGLSAVNTPSSSSDDSLPASVSLNDSSLDSEFSQSSLPFQINCFPDLSQNEWQYVQYYVEKLSDLLLNGHAPRNPLRSLIVPRMLSSPILSKAVCSVSAQHRANSCRDQKDKLQMAATSYYLEALSLLKTRIPYISLLRDTSGAYYSESLEILLLASVFLCKHEIIKGGVENWRPHLVGIESFCGFLERDRPSCMVETLTYARSFITYHRSIASITEQALSTLHHTPKHIRKVVEPGDSAYVIDPYMGVSQGLVLVLQRVALLVGFEFEQEGQRALLEVEVESIIDCVQQRNWRSKLAAFPPGMPVASTTPLIHIALAYENAIFAYLHSVIDGISERDIFCHHLDLWDKLRKMLPTTRNEAVSSCLRAMSLVKIGAPEEPGLLPLLFVISCVAESPEQTWTILKRVENLAMHFCLGNMKFVGEFVREIWRRRVQLGHWHDWRSLLAQYKWDLMLC